MKKLIKKIGIISATTIATLSGTIGFATTAHAKVNLPEIRHRQAFTLINGNDNKGDDPNGKLSKWTLLNTCNVREYEDGINRKKYIVPIVVNIISVEKKLSKICDYYKNDINNKNYRPSIMQEIHYNLETSALSRLQAKEYMYPASLYFTKTPNYMVKVYGKDYSETPVDLNNMPTKKWIDDNVHYLFNDKVISEKSYEAYANRIKSSIAKLKTNYYKEACDVIDYIFNIGEYDIDKPNHKKGWAMNSSSYFKTNTNNTRFEYDEKNAYKIAGEEEREEGVVVVNEKSTLTCLSTDVLSQIKTILTKNGYWWETIDEYPRIYIKTIKKTEIKNLLNANGITKFSII